MVKKKSEDKKEKPAPKKTAKTSNDEVIVVEKYSISELLESNKVKPLDAVGFLNYYGLTENFKKEIEYGEVIVRFSKGEFNDMFERYIKREI